MSDMNGVQEAIPYAEVAAYQANQGISLYALPSGGTQTGGFVVSWNINSGFTGQGWDETTWASPAFNKTQDNLEDDAADGNLNDTFSDWAERVDFSDRLNWVTDWMNDKGCVTEYQA